MTAPSRSRRSALLVHVLRAVAVAGLAVDALIHLRLAGPFDAIGEQITLGALFRLEAAAAAAAGLYLSLRDSRLAWLCAGLVAAGGLAALLVAVLEPPAVGPFPPLAAPGWTTDSVLVTAAMAITVVAWLVREALRRRPG
jgi:hypothetical protein